MVPKKTTDNGKSAKKGEFVIDLNVPKINYKLLIGGTLATLTVSTVLTVLAVSAIANWFDHNRIVTHPIVEVKFNAPFSIEAREVELVSPIATESAEISMDVPKVEEITPTPEVKGEKLTISSNGIKCVNQNPGLSGKIKDKYGDEWQLAAELICRESSFNPGAINPTSGACGLAQALPCKKMQCELSDIDCQLNWIGDYVENRYGNFEEAIRFHDEKGWY